MKQSSDREYIDSKLKELEDIVKERESSVLRAIKTLIQDLSDFQRGKRSDFPRAALYGAIFAYLRPRVVLVLGSIGAVVVGAIQLWFLFNQTTLLRQQNELVEIQNSYVDSQTESNRLQAVTSVLANIDDEDPNSVEMAVAQLSSFGPEGFDVLMQLARADSLQMAEAAQKGVSRSAGSHSDAQGTRAVAMLMENMIAVSTVLESYSELTQNGLGADIEPAEVFDVAHDWISAGRRLNEYLNLYSNSGNQPPIPRISDALLENAIQKIYFDSQARYRSVAFARERVHASAARTLGTYAAFEHQQEVLLDQLSVHIELWCDQPAASDSCETIATAE